MRKNVSEIANRGGHSRSSTMSQLITDSGRPMTSACGLKATRPSVAETAKPSQGNRGR